MKIAAVADSPGISAGREGQAKPVAAHSGEGLRRERTFSCRRPGAPGGAYGFSGKARLSGGRSQGGTLTPVMRCMNGGELEARPRGTQPEIPAPLIGGANGPRRAITRSRRAFERQAALTSVRIPHLRTGWKSHPRRSRAWRPSFLPLSWVSWSEKAARCAPSPARLEP